MYGLADSGLTSSLGRKGVRPPKATLSEEVPPCCLLLLHPVHFLHRTYQPRLFSLSSGVVAP